MDRSSTAMNYFQPPGLAQPPVHNSFRFGPVNPAFADDFSLHGADDGAEHADSKRRRIARVRRPAPDAAGALG